MSGLAAAVRLSDAGIRAITIFEARARAGGRTRSYVDPTTGDILDNGQHLLMGCYTSTLDYLRHIGSEHLLDRIPLRIPFWSASGVRSFTIDRSLAPPMNLLAALARTSLLTLGEKRAAAKLGFAIWRSKLPKDLDQMTCADFFQYFAQPLSLIAKLWSPIVLATINATPDTASAELFVNVLREAFFSGRSASMLLMPQCGLSKLLVDPAITYLENSGISVRLGSPVRGIQWNENKYEVVSDTETISFDAVINAAPQSSLWPVEIRNPMPDIIYSPIVNAYFWLDRPVLKAPAPFKGQPVHAFVGTTLQWAFPKRSGFCAGAHACAERLALTVSAAESLVEMPNEEIRDILWDDLKRTVPAAANATLLHWQIIREKRATPLFTPELQRSRPASSTSMNNFFVAGDIVQNGLPATIEGAIRNGCAAAELLIKHSRG